LEEHKKSFAENHLEMVLRQHEVTKKDLERSYEVFANRFMLSRLLEFVCRQVTWRNKKQPIKSRSKGFCHHLSLLDAKENENLNLIVKTTQRASMEFTRSSYKIQNEMKFLTENDVEYFQLFKNLCESMRPNMFYERNQREMYIKVNIDQYYDPKYRPEENRLRVRMSPNHTEILRSRRDSDHCKFSNSNVTIHVLNRRVDEQSNKVITRGYFDIYLFKDGWEQENTDTYVLHPKGGEIGNGRGYNCNGQWVCMYFHTWFLCDGHVLILLRRK